MGIDPGRTDGGRPKIGARVEVRLTPGDVARIDALLREARRRYQRVPRELRGRAPLIRACLRGQLGAWERRVWARPAPREEES